MWLMSCAVMVVTWLIMWLMSCTVMVVMWLIMSCRSHIMWAVSMFDRARPIVMQSCVMQSCVILQFRSMLQLRCGLTESCPGGTGVTVSLARQNVDP